MNSFFLIFLVQWISYIAAANQNPGHLKAFGSVGSLINIKELSGELPTVSKLFTYYISKSEPVLARQVLNSNPHYSTWQSDNQLENDVYGLSSTEILVDSFASGRRQRIEMTFGDFLQRYRTEPLLFADSVPDLLQKYLVVPLPLQCEAVLDTFQSAILVINGMNASPLMFNEEFDHFHCILRGSKRIVLLDAIKYPDVRKIVIPEDRKFRGPPINPDRVDLDQFPALADVDYHIANLTSGDCLFIPHTWIFQERSLENSISVIYNIKHHDALNVDVSELKSCPAYDDTFTLDQIDWSTNRHPQNFRDLIMNLVRTKAEGFDKWQEVFSKHLSYDLASDPEVSSIFEEFYGIVDVDGDGQVTAAEVEQINGAHQHHITDVIYEMASVINKKRKIDANKKSDETEDTEQTLTPEEEDDDSDDVLHQQNYKTDL